MHINVQNILLQTIIYHYVFLKVNCSELYFLQMQVAFCLVAVANVLAVPPRIDNPIHIIVPFAKSIDVSGLPDIVTKDGQNLQLTAAQAALGPTAPLLVPTLD